MKKEKQFQCNLARIRVKKKIKPLVKAVVWHLRQKKNVKESQRRYQLLDNEKEQKKGKTKASKKSGSNDKTSEDFILEVGDSLLKDISNAMVLDSKDDELWNETLLESDIKLQEICRGDNDNEDNNYSSNEQEETVLPKELDVQSGERIATDNTNNAIQPKCTLLYRRNEGIKYST